MWTATGSMATAREWHTATLLPNGQVLVAGGFGGTTGCLASAELYDPATGMWTATGSMATARYVHTATLLPNGQVLVAGGRSGFDVIASAELYDPASGMWTATASLGPVRVVSYCDVAAEWACACLRRRVLARTLLRARNSTNRRQKRSTFNSAALVKG